MSNEGPADESFAPARCALQQHDALVFTSKLPKHAALHQKRRTLAWQRPACVKVCQHVKHKSSACLVGSNVCQRMPACGFDFPICTVISEGGQRAKVCWCRCMSGGRGWGGKGWRWGAVVRSWSRPMRRDTAMSHTVATRNAMHGAIWGAARGARTLPSMSHRCTFIMAHVLSTNSTTIPLVTAIVAEIRGSTS